MTREEARQKLIDIIDWHVQDALERMCLELDVDEYYDALDTLYDGPKGNMISRDDAIAAVTMAALEDKDEIEALKALPSVQVSGDLISRADAIEAVKETKPIVRSTERNWGKMIADEHSKELVKALKALPSAEAVQGWIPCSERLPLVSGEFLVTLVDNDGTWVSTAQWNMTFGGRWQDIFPDDGYRDISNVIAWKTLPIPYTKGDNDEER